MSWYEAAAYCAWAGVRLLREAEWERATRGTEGRKYPWGDEESDATRANYLNNGPSQPTPVGLYPAGATPQGVFDMAGNVWEWVSDWYGQYPEENEENPRGPREGTVRVLRGGSWIKDQRILRAAYRGRYGPEVRSSYIGFRCARDVFP